MGGPGSGPRRKPTALHIREGTYNRTRHGGRAEAEYPAGEPRQPKGLGRDGKWMWDHVVESTPTGVLNTVDSASLFAMCRWWEIYRKLDRAMTTKKNMESSNVLAATRAFKHFENLASQFGLTPTARAKLKLPVRPLGVVRDELADMARRRG